MVLTAVLRPFSPASPELSDRRIFHGSDNVTVDSQSIQADSTKQTISIFNELDSGTSRVNQAASSSIQDTINVVC